MRHKFCLDGGGEEAIDKPLSDVVRVENEAGELIEAEKRPMAIALATGMTTTTSTTTTTTTTDSGVIPERKIIIGTYYYLRKDKTRFPVTMTVTPVILNNSIVAAIEVFRDSSKEKEIDKAKTEFVSLSSHQLRGPITAIKWYTEMLLSGDAGPLAEKQISFFEEIHRASQRMEDLVDALLNISRLELGVLFVEPMPTDVAFVIRQVVNEQKLEADKKNIVCTIRFADDLPMILTDPKLFRIVIVNILSNAVKYTPPKGTVACSIRPVAGGEVVGGRAVKKEGVLVTIADTGYGIPANQQDKIFSKLFRADNVRAINVDGTGLGLYIVKLVVDRLGGQVWFESQEQKGTTFFVVLSSLA